MIVLPKIVNAKSCSDHRTISLISHSGNTVARILSKRMESRIEGVIEEDQIAFWNCKDTRDAIVIMRIMSKSVLDVNEEMCLCFIVLAKGF